MMFEANVDATRALAFLRNGQQHVAYSIVNALNATAKDIQAAERDHAAGVLKLRGQRAALLKRVAVITPFASVKAGRYEVKVQIANRKKGTLLPMLETGGLHMPSRSAPYVAIPSLGGARPTPLADVDPEVFIKKLKLTQQGRTRRGLYGTFVIGGKGIFQRTAEGVRALYVMRPEVPVPPRLGWERLAMAKAVERFPVHLSAQVDDAIAHEFQHAVEEAFKS